MIFIEWLVERDACSNCLEWAKSTKISSASQAWAKLQRPDWMLWLVQEAGVKLDDAKLRHFAADCAEAVLPIFEKERPDDKRPRLAIQAARDYADGKISGAALAVASAAASDAASSAAWDAASDVASAADSDAAWDAARAAARTDAWDAASDVASAADSDAASAAQAKNLRKYFKDPFKGWNPATQTQVTK